LVRRPIVMIRVEFLKDQFRKNNGSLGKVAEEPKFLYGKTLSEIPADMFRVFVELEPRRERLRHIESLLPDCETEDEKRALRDERDLIQDWLEQYGPTFDEAQSGNRPVRAKELRTLCPVSYKTIELGLRHNIPGF
jgi:hypothetical protein